MIWDSGDWVDITKVELELELDMYSHDTMDVFCFVLFCFLLERAWSWIFSFS